MKNQKTFTIVSLLAVLAISVGFAYHWYSRMLVSQGVSTDLRPGTPCDQTSPNPCPTP